jgi:Zn-dependent protease with chaperone function
MRFRFAVEGRRDMPFLLMVFFVAVCMPDPSAWPQPWWWTNSPWECALVTWAVAALTGVHAFFVSRRVRRLHAVVPARRERLLRRYERGRFHHQIGLFIVYLLLLLVVGWGWAVGQLWQTAAQASLPGGELLVLAPYVVSQMLAWGIYFDAEKAAHLAAHRSLAAEAGAGAWLELERPRAAATAFGGRVSYVLFQARQKLGLVFLPVGLLLIQKEVIRFLPDLSNEWQGALHLGGILAVLLVFAAMPWIVRLVLGLRSLPPGALRDRLENSASRLGFKCSDILLWNTRHGMANAMVIGIVPWIRYVVFTDRLLEEFAPEEVEAVFGHEIGHVRHHHMLYYLGFLLGSVVVLGGLWSLVEARWNVSKDLKQYHYLAFVPMVTILLTYVFIVFGFLSRRCERQADVFGCRAVSCSQADCLGHDHEAVLAGTGRELCPTGIRTFIRALEKVALINGISRHRPGFLQSWQHSTIARRVEFLQSVLIDPAVERHFQRRVFVFKCVLLVVLGGAVSFVLSHSWEL